MPEEEAHQNSASGTCRTCLGWAAAGVAFVFVHEVHTRYWKQKWLRERDSEQKQWAEEEIKEGEEAEYRALGVDVDETVNQEGQGEVD